MTDLKWSGKQIIEFLNIFQNYPCLWDVSTTDYLNKSIKEEAFKKLQQNVDEAGIPASLDALKKKIKSLRDTYRKEIYKVKKSIKSGAGASEIYKPKLVWFSTAEVFWHGAVIGRESESNLEIPIEEDEQELSSDIGNMLEQGASQQLEPSEASRHSASTRPSSSAKRPSTNMKPPQRAKVSKGLTAKRKPTRFESAVDKLQTLANELTTDDTDDEYETFGKHIASQMRQLPLNSLIRLQSEFQSLISRERLAYLNKNYTEESQSIFNVSEAMGPLTSSTNVSDAMGLLTSSTNIELDENHSNGNINIVNIDHDYVQP